MAQIGFRRRVAAMEAGISILKKTAIKVIPESLAGMTLLLCIAVVVVWSCFRARKQLRESLPFILFFALGAALFWPLTPPTVEVRSNHLIWTRTLSPLGGVLAVGCLLLGIWHCWKNRGQGITAQSDSEVRCDGLNTCGTCARFENLLLLCRNGNAYLVLAVVLASVFLFYNLGEYLGVLHTWESTVVFEFATAFHRGQSVGDFSLRSLLWDNGVLSQGNTSLFYGAPTYALFHVLGFSTCTLRVLSAVASLAFGLVMYLFARRCFGKPAAVGVAVFLSLNACTLFYGRYGSSPAGTLLALSLALLATWCFLDNLHPPLWSGALCALSLYAATLQYSPVRLVVLLLIGLILTVVIHQWRMINRRRIVGVVSIAAILVGIWYVQDDHKTSEYFFHGRGEQALSFLQNPQRAKNYLQIEVTEDDLRFPSNLRLIHALLKITIPQYLSLVLPSRFDTYGTRGMVASGQPPLYFGPLGLFIILGLIRSVMRAGSWKHAFPVVMVVLASGPLLLTNRVDSHRIMFFVVPLSLWAGLGIAETSRVLASFRLPRLVPHVFAALLLAVVVYSNVDSLYLLTPTTRATGESVLRRCESLDGSVLVGLAVDNKERHWVQLQLVERSRRDRRQTGDLLDNKILHPLLDKASAEEREKAVLALRKTIEQSGTVLLAPLGRFSSAQILLQQHGYIVHVVTIDNIAMLEVDIVRELIVPVSEASSM